MAARGADWGGVNRRERCGYKTDEDWQDRISSLERAAVDG